MTDVPDVWQRLKDALVGDGLSVETIEYSLATSSEVGAWVFRDGELLAHISLAHNESQDIFKAAKKKLPAVLEDAGFKPFKQPKDARTLFYQKSDDARRSQKIMVLGLSQIEAIETLLQDKQYTKAEIMYGYSTVIDGASVYGYSLSCKGPNGENASVSITRKATLSLQADLDSLFEKHGWTKTETDIDPRGGMQGNILYARL